MSTQAIVILFYLSLCGTVATALVAHARNRNWFAWLLLAGIVNPIVAWPLLMCLPAGGTVASGLEPASAGSRDEAEAEGAPRRDVEAEEAIVRDVRSSWTGRK